MHMNGAVVSPRNCNYAAVLLLQLPAVYVVAAGCCGIAIMPVLSSHVLGRPDSHANSHTHTTHTRTERTKTHTHL